MTRRALEIGRGGRRRARLVGLQGDNAIARSTEEELGEDFSYIVRMADTDMDGLKPMGTALTQIKGIGARTARILCGMGDFDAGQKIGLLDKDALDRLRDLVENFAANVGELDPEAPPWWLLNRQKDLESGDEVHLTGQQVKFNQQDDITRLRSIKSYRGIRHASGNKVRGQRGRSNGRRGLTLGVERKK